MNISAIFLKSTVRILQLVLVTGALFSPDSVFALNKLDVNSAFSQNHQQATQDRQYLYIQALTESSSTRVMENDILYASVDAPDATSQQLEHAPVASTPDALYDLQNLDLSASLYYRNFDDAGFLQDSLFSLFEGTYSTDESELEMGVSYQNLSDSALSLNHLSFNQYYNDFDYEIGKFVVKIGVLDYLSSINTFNLSRFEYFDELNINVRYIPAWLLRLNWYTDEESTLSLIVQPHDDNNASYLKSSVQLSLDTAAPYLLTDTGNRDLDLIGDQILLPLYNKQIRQLANSYINSKIPHESATLDNTTIGLNYIANKDGYTFGVLLLNAYSQLPLISLDDDLLDVVANLDEEDKLPFIRNYLVNAENEPVKSIESFRYNQLGIYYETSASTFGLRGELSYRDRFPLLNETTELLNIGLGIDHKGYLYNNIEMQYVTFSRTDLTAKYIIWLSQFDPVRVRHWEIGFKNIFSHADYNQKTVSANLSRLTFRYKKIDISLEYLMHSRQEFSSNITSIYMKIIF